MHACMYACNACMHPCMYVTIILDCTIYMCVYLVHMQALCVCSRCRLSNIRVMLLLIDWINASHRTYAPSVIRPMYIFNGTELVAINGISHVGESAASPITSSIAPVVGMHPRVEDEMQSGITNID